MGEWGAFFSGNFLPDVTAVHEHRRLGDGHRGPSIHSGSLRPPGTPFRIAGPSMPVGTYKKAHRHGPGISIVIPGEADGYSIMWPEGGDKEIIPWHEASCFIPPNGWYHQHFNAGDKPAKYMPFHTPRHRLFGGQRGADRWPRNQIEYPDEETWIREKFEAELAKRGVKNQMQPQCYEDPSFVWEPNEHGDE